jgi:lysophospholipase L1-like esterase
MNKRMGLLALALAVAALATTARAQEPGGELRLKAGDRVVFYGDSITDQRLYTTFAETYLVTRFPGLDLTFVHSGWGGDRVTGGGGGPIDLRLARDVFAYKPTVLTIMLGMNDGSRAAFNDKTFKVFSTGYLHILASVKKTLPDCWVTVIEPSPYDDVTRPLDFEGGYNETLVKYGEWLRGIAGRDGLGVADLNAPVVAALKRAHEHDPKLAPKMIADRIHPGPAGHLLMAEALLKAWNAARPVSRVEIDAVSGKAVHAEATTVADVAVIGSTLSWTQDDEALPLPIDMKDAMIALAVKSSDVAEVLDDERLVVTGLAAASAKLTIDGEVVGTFTKEQLALGVNLGILPTPMWKQAAHVHQLTLKRAEVHQVRWRQIQVPLEKEAPASLAKALEGLDALDAEVAKQQREAARPKKRRYELESQ